MSISDQARKIQTGQLAIDLSSEIETGHYLSTQKWGWFTTLHREQGKSRAHQKSYKLRDLPQILDLISQDRRDVDWWISQAVFTKPNRRKVNLAHVGLAFVDLDYYRFPGLACLSEGEILDRLSLHCEQNTIPLPSLVIDSGKGLQIKWFHEPLPRQALPRWDALQKGLVKTFEALGADANARDISRVLRVVRTTNQKTGRAVRVIWVNTDYDILDPKQYVFNDLVNDVLPPLPEHAGKGRRVFGGVVNPLKLNAAQRGFTPNSLNWARLCDLQKLIELRGGDMGDGLREPMAFWLCNFFALRYCKELAMNPLDEWNEFRQLCLQAAPHWDSGKIKDKTSNLYRLTRETAAGKTVPFCGKKYSPLFTPGSQFLIDAFGMTSDEISQMDTIHDTAEKAKRQNLRDQARKGWEQSREEYEAGRQEEKMAKAREAQKLKAHGLSGRRIAHEMGVSEAMVRKYLKVRTGGPL